MIYLSAVRGIAAVVAEEGKHNIRQYFLNRAESRFYKFPSD